MYLHKYIKQQSGRRIGVIIGQTFDDGKTVVITFSKCHKKDLENSYKTLNVETGREVKCSIFKPEEMLNRAFAKAEKIHEDHTAMDKIRPFSRSIANHFIERCEGYFQQAEMIVVGFPL